MLSEAQWQALKAQHQNQLKPIVKAHRQRRERQEKHPVIDFLFEYYHFKPAKLLQWSPGIDYRLQGQSTIEFLSQTEFQQDHTGMYLDPAVFPSHRLSGLKWTIDLLNATLNNAPQFNCFGLHEWCMIYNPKDIRHPQLGLRLAHDKVKSVVRQHPVQCTHYDAFRFYSAEAVKFNKIPLTREQMQRNEQAGCLHTNMDLYRWAYKYYPWVSSELIRDAFLLALDIRETDMLASPYDVSAFTSKPAIKIETTRGKSEYIERQKQFSQRSQPIRTALLATLERLQHQVLKDNTPMKKVVTSHLHS